MNADSAPADPGRLYWCCDGERFNALLARARRIAAAQDLDALADQLRAIDHAWIHAQVTDDERRALLVLGQRRASRLKPKGPLARALRLPGRPPTPGRVVVLEPLEKLNDSEAGTRYRGRSQHKNRA